VLLVPRWNSGAQARVGSDTGGAPIVHRDGDEATIFTWGPCVRLTLEALDEGARAATVVELPQLSPLPTAEIAALAAKTGRVLVVHGGPGSHGVGAEIAAVIADAAILHLDGPVVRVSGSPGPHAPAAEADALPDPVAILAGLDRVAHAPSPALPPV
jgi:pyruvate/2-oxoglutarate/acetoin dehydrogenase E1 component